MAAVTAKETRPLRDSFRFQDEYATGGEPLREEPIGTARSISHTVPLGEAENAFRAADDRTQSVKVRIAFA